MTNDALTYESLRLRDMRSEDLSQIVALEGNAHISPWARLSFEESLNRQDVCRVIENNKSIIAYHVVSPILDELHVLNVVVAPSMQGLGLGHRLMQDIIDNARAAKLIKIFLEVRISNQVAQSLYQKWQFKQIAIRKNYYRVATRKPKSIRSESEKAQTNSPAKNIEDSREHALVFLRQL